MYVKQIVAVNLGPITHIHIRPGFSSDGRPRAVVLVGPNGAGKSIILSLVLDALIESKKISWLKIKEVKKDEYIKLMSGQYIRTGENFSYCYTKISDNKEDIGIEEIVSRVDRQTFEASFANLTTMHGNPPPSFCLDTPFHKSVEASGSFKNVAKNFPFLFFPYFRYEMPAWLNENTADTFDTPESHFGINPSDVLQIGLIDKIIQWILDIVLDRELYEKLNIPAQLIDGNITRLVYPGAYDGPNHNTLTLLQQIIREILLEKFPGLGYVRFGITKKPYRAVSIYIQLNGKEVIYVPRLQQLSSGELMVLSICATIIRAYEKCKGNVPSSLLDIVGIVAIDEIDLHMHISLQKIVLPKIISMFPHVQFIISTHSPFFVVGLSESVSAGADIFEMPSGLRIEPNEFSEFRVAYDAFVEVNGRYRLAYENIMRQLERNSKPLVVTEGKTDWRHLKSACDRLVRANAIADIGLDFLEYDDDVNMGDDKLSKMCENMALIDHSRKVIFIFDRDVSGIVDKMGGSDGKPYKKWSRDIYSMCIPIPSHRGSYNNISIEFYYTDDEIKTVDESTGRRLFFSNELEEFKSPGDRRMQIRIMSSEPQNEFDKKVFDHECQRIMDPHGKCVAHSKTVFAQNVYEGKNGFGCFDIKEFIALFDIIRMIINDTGDINSE